MQVDGPVCVEVRHLDHVAVVAEERLVVQAAAKKAAVLLDHDRAALGVEPDAQNIPIHRRSDV
ncbi:hypothetical protein DLJ57_20920 [Micromonospora chalcea]|nr:hypothetical protein A8711_08795 [Micromonospora sp. II]RQX30535.1 hypothetical protein DLJ57_20920 [Micromonospora chalcea]